MISTKPNNIGVAQQLRVFIDEGLKVKGYVEDIDFIAQIIRDEFRAVYHISDIKTIVEQQTDRIAKILMKTGKLSTSEFFLTVKMLMFLWGKDCDEYMLQDMINSSMKVGIEYMQRKDANINKLLEDTNFIMDTAYNL